MSPVVPDTPDRDIAEIARHRQAVFPSREAAAARYRERPPFANWDPDAFAGYIEGAFVDRSDGSVELACAPVNEARIYEAAPRFHVYERLGSIACPVAIGRGTATDVLSEKGGNAIAAQLVNGSIAEFAVWTTSVRSRTRRRSSQPCCPRQTQPGRSLAAAMSLSLPSSLSPSKLARFVQCPLAFRYAYIDRLPEPSSIQQVRGTLVHRALELLFSSAQGNNRTRATREHRSGPPSTSSRCPTSSPGWHSTTPVAVAFFTTRPSSSSATSRSRTRQR